MTEQEKREKVIKGLECCMINPDFCDRTNCPYAVESDENDYCDTKLIKDALALLKAQAPDETRLVRHYTRPNVYADLWLHCEKCGGRVDDRYKPKFCPECGRAVKWDG